MAFSKESKKKEKKLAKSRLLFSHPFHVDVVIAGYKKRHRQVTLGNNNSLCVIIREQ